MRCASVDRFHPSHAADLSPFFLLFPLRCRLPHFLSLATAVVGPQGEISHDDSRLWKDASKKCSKKWIPSLLLLYFPPLAIRFDSMSSVHRGSFPNGTHWGAAMSFSREKTTARHGEYFWGASPTTNARPTDGSEPLYDSLCETMSTQTPTSNADTVAFFFACGASRTRDVFHPSPNCGTLSHGRCGSDWGGLVVFPLFWRTLGHPRSLCGSSTPIHRPPPRADDPGPPFSIGACGCLLLFVSPGSFHACYLHERIPCETPSSASRFSLPPHGPFSSHAVARCKEWGQQPAVG